jgi:6-pyruvoyl-tetrahydropterin synthase
LTARFSIHVAKENLKFSAAHFIAYPGFREALHGHNYQVGVRIEGQLAATGYVLDFGLVKRLMREILARLDERTLIPARSDCLTIQQRADTIALRYQDDEFLFPSSDCAVLPIVHSSAEELARYLWGELRTRLDHEGALAGVKSIEVSVAEAPGQAAIFHNIIAEN